MDIEYMYASYSSYVYRRIYKIFTDSCFCFSVVFLRLTYPVVYCSAVHVQCCIIFYMKILQLPSLFVQVLVIRWWSVLRFLCVQGFV